MKNVHAIVSFRNTSHLGDEERERLLEKVQSAVDMVLAMELIDVSGEVIPLSGVSLDRDGWGAELVPSEHRENIDAVPCSRIEALTPAIRCRLEECEILTFGQLRRLEFTELGSVLKFKLPQTRRLRALLCNKGYYFAGDEKPCIHGDLGFFSLPRFLNALSTAGVCFTWEYALHNPILSRFGARLVKPPSAVVEPSPEPGLIHADVDSLPSHMLQLEGISDLGAAQGLSVSLKVLSQRSVNEVRPKYADFFREQLAAKGLSFRDEYLLDVPGVGRIAHGQLASCLRRNGFSVR